MLKKLQGLKDMKELDAFIEKRIKHIFMFALVLFWTLLIFTVCKCHAGDVVVNQGEVVIQGDIYGGVNVDNRRIYKESWRYNRPNYRTYIPMPPYDGTQIICGPNGETRLRIGDNWIEFGY